MRNNIHCEYCNESDGEHAPECPAGIFSDLMGEPKEEKPLDFGPSRQKQELGFNTVGRMTAHFDRTPELDKIMGIGDGEETSFPITKGDGTVPDDLVEQVQAGIHVRRAEVRQQYGKGASVVPPYKPNRKQRRAQAAAKRAQAKKNKPQPPKE